MSGQTRVRIDVNGRVQGVGFRPTVYRYALERGLVGWVSNTSHGVIIELEGISESVDDFIETLKSAPPPQAKITDITTRNLPLKQDKKFEIRPSVVAANAKTQISADISTCSDCLSELKDSKDRRYGYPFLNCTNCGPRFTIIKDIPYDRCKTTMDEFKMCPKCQAEYDDPSNRRFHAQPNACYQCGPQLTLIKSTTLTPSTMERPTSHVLRPSALASTLEVLRRGKIVAIKGLGGYHLACDALNDEAVRNLRSRKFREDKCFALMAADIDTIKKYCHVSKEEEELLLSYKRPIVLLRRKIPNPKSKIPKIVEDVAPNNKYLGFMLPYTPLHHLLFTNNERRTTNDEPRVLVMTSGNTSDEPIAYKDQDASKRLCHIADYYLTHNREVHMRTDDSVSRIFSTTGKESIVRRSRGYAPSPIRVPFKFNHQVLACGAHLKNTFALARDNEVFVSHHIGDLGNFETINAFGSGVKHFEKLLNIKPEVVACDLHHAYYSTKYAKDLSTLNSQLSTIPVQHHHAHIASCMADNGLTNRKVIGVALDGTGLGTDEKIWGGEFLVADYKSFERAGHFKYVPLPGGEHAITEPWRVAVSYLYQTYGPEFINLDLDFNKRLNRDTWLIMERMLQNDFNCPLTSSAGRLFDAVSSLIGLRDEITFEGQAAIDLEMAINSEWRPETGNKGYEYSVEKINGVYIINPDSTIKNIVDDLQKGVSTPTISGKFHATLANIVLNMCEKISKDTGLKEIALSGGCFQNMRLLKITYNILVNKGFKVYIHHQVPANDGGISLGQCAIAMNKSKIQDSKSKF